MSETAEKITIHLAEPVNNPAAIPMTPSPSRSACGKKRGKRTAEGWPVHSLRTLLRDLATRCKNTCRAGEGKTAIRFEQLTEVTPFQEHVFGLLELKP